MSPIRLVGETSVSQEVDTSESSDFNSCISRRKKECHQHLVVCQSNKGLQHRTYSRASEGCTALLTTQTHCTIFLQVPPRLEGDNPEDHILY
jgi:hypothetical protein